MFGVENKKKILHNEDIHSSPTLSVCKESKITCGIIILSLFWEVIKSVRIPIFGLAGHYYLKFVYYLKNPQFLHSFF